jgi:hypothetical protein
MKKYILVAAAAASLMLAGCGGGTDDDEIVSVTVTGAANVRDAATAEGSNVLETLSAGTELTGRWVESDTNPSEQWFEYERDGEKVYVWGRNLISQDGNDRIVADEEPKEHVNFLIGKCVLGPGDDENLNRVYETCSEDKFKDMQMTRGSVIFREYTIDTLAYIKENFKGESVNEFFKTSNPVSYEFGDDGSITTVSEVDGCIISEKYVHKNGKFFSQKLPSRGSCTDVQIALANRKIDNQVRSGKQYSEIFLIKAD